MVDRVHHQGGPGKVSVQGMKEAKTAATTILGDVKQLSQGREIVYCFVTAAITGAGIIYGTKPNQANHSNVVVRTTASINTNAVTICAGATAIVADDYKDGWLLVNDSTGEGHAYMIDRHASASSGTGVTVYLKDKLEVALTTASEVTLVYNIGNVQRAKNSAAVTACPRGVSLITAAASSYVWMGKSGPWPCVCEGTPRPGAEASLSSAGVTCIASAVTTASVVVGFFMTTAAASEFTMVDLKL